MSRPIFSRSISKVRDEGFLEFISSSKDFGHRIVERSFLEWKYQRMYGAVAPRYSETLEIPAEMLQFSIATKYIPEEAPLFGVIGGDWDREKSRYECGAWDGIRQRFEEGYSWEETKYYRKTKELIESGKGTNKLDIPKSDQTIETLDDYVTHLDNVFRSLKIEGFDKNQPITICIGRDGDVMVHHGNHRANMARILGLEVVPAIVRYRHEDWQELRLKISNCNYNRLSNLNSKELINHPDLVLCLE